MYLFRGMNRAVLGQVKGDLEREPGPVNLCQLERTKKRHLYVFFGVRIREILRRIRILVSVHWITDPDPALFFVAFKNLTKISVFYVNFFAYYLL